MLGADFDEFLFKCKVGTEVASNRLRQSATGLDTGCARLQVFPEKLVMEMASALVVYRLPDGDLEIYADLLLGRVFFAIVDNTIRHGEKTTHIRFSAQESGEGLTIFCQDDGVGVPHKVKEGLFRHEYDQITGYGLFYAAEILRMTELSVVETGEPGSGARFEIRVPKGRYRYT